MRLPEHITFTGVDARTNLVWVKELSDRYPIEWGILLSPKRQGVENRYPDPAAIEPFLKSGLDLAVHICGDHSRAIMAGEMPDLPLGIGRFDRAQINHAAPVANRILDLFPLWGPRCITQSRTPKFPAEDSLDWLYDCSGGKGEMPEAWPEHPGGERLVGFAGGIGPENVQAVLEKIACTGPYWIDMESRVRTDDWLDLHKVEAVCRAVYG